MKQIVKVLGFVAVDMICATAAWVISALILRYDFFSMMKEPYMWLMLVAGMLVAVGAHLAFGLYKRLWKYAGLEEIIKIGFSSLIFGIYLFIVADISAILQVEWAMITFFMYFSACALVRFLHRFYGTIENYGNKSRQKKINVMIIGAGNACSILIREMQSLGNVNMHPVCVLDDDKFKIGQKINGVSVVGNIESVEEVALKYNIDEIIIAIPSASRKRISEIIALCQNTCCVVKIVPAVDKIASGKVSMQDVKKVEIKDLLGREQVIVNTSEIIGYIEDKKVLVTGGGGSIGSELCRQIAKYNPRQLIIVDIYENNAYEIEQELKRHYPNLNLLTLIASVRDTARVNDIFATYKPEVVFHAAAHKHVPLMETSPNEAIKNNVHGTFNVATAAGQNGASKFVLISTDKAVNPTNIMGATKRICEMIIQTLDKRYDTDYVAVRFGNVLGSNGSVIPLFAKQIEEGGPVTVTHEDIVRYFMTIPEAVSLVLQAGAYASHGEIFVLDMGEPVRIYDLAVKMIKLSGLELGKDIDIKVTGLRPGEKLYEERLMDEEGLKKTANQSISIGKPIDFDEQKLLETIDMLYKEARHETDNIKDLVHGLVPTYKVSK